MEFLEEDGSAELAAAGWAPRVKDVRLPYTVIPLHYNLRLQANIYGDNPDAFNFNGSVEIRLQCLEATDVFFVHAHRILNVDVSSIKVQER